MNKPLSIDYDHKEYFFEYSINCMNDEYSFEIFILDSSLQARYGNTMHFSIENDKVNLNPEKPYDAFIKMILLNKICELENINVAH
jgi:hypothetical protein